MAGIIQLHSTLKIQRQPEVLEQYGFKKSTLYTRIKEGLVPPPISLGGLRAVGWIEYETQLVIAAMCAGKSQDEIKQLVINLIAQRNELGGAV
jgi:prophage regulatory protein